MTTDQPPPGGLAAAGLPPLAEAKLAPPRPRPGIVARPRIMEMLDGGWRSALTVVAALAWVTLDASDADPVRLWTYAATAVDRVRQGLGARALRRLTVTGGPIENPIDELMEGIATLGRELVLVLDDLQAVTDPDCFASLEYAIRRVPANARLIAITRSDPPLPLAHLRARGMLAELRAGDLAFTASETREFLAEHGPAELAPEEVDQLQERTEGWPAALLLASLWLNSRDDLHGAVRRFGGDHRFVADYLSSEVFGSLDGGARSFLLRVAVLGRFTAALVDSVLGRSDSAAILADLERTNLFVERLELGGWYRVHSLFAEFAGFQLAAQEPEAVPEIHRRAAAWLRPRGLMVEGAEHAAGAGDHDVVAELLVEYHLPLIRGGGAGTLLRWVRALPEAQLVLHPELAVGAATAATMVGGAFERRQFLNLAERARVEEPARFTPYVEAVAAMVRASAVDRDVGEAVIQGRRAVAIAETGADDAIVAALGGYARALYLAGDLDAAWDAALRAIEHADVARRVPGHAFARSTLALVAVDRGRLETARLHADRAKALLGGAGSIRSWLGANASAALGAVLAAEGDYAEAEREVVNADRFFRDEVATVHHAWLMVLLARIRCARGRIDDARDALRLALDAIGELGDCGRVPAL